MKLLFANNAGSVLANGITAAATQLSVAAGHGARFPQPAAGEGFYLTLMQIVAGIEQNYEIVLVTERSIDTLTIVRGQEGTAARAYLSGDTVSHRPTAQTMRAFAQPSELVAFGVTPTAPTAAPGTNNTTMATTQFAMTEIATAVAALVDSSPAALNTLDELAQALGDDANFAATTAAALGNRLRVDTAAQGLTVQQQTNARTNLGLQNSVPDVSNGVAGLTGFWHNLFNAAGTIKSMIASAATAARTWTFPDKSGTVAMTSDILDATMQSQNGGPLAGFRNFVINGSCAVAQRGSTYFPDGSLRYGGVDRIFAYSAGFSTYTGQMNRVSVSGAFMQEVYATGAGAGVGAVIGMATRLEAADVAKLNSKLVTFAVTLGQYTGTTLNVTLAIRKANAVDNFSANTLIASQTVSLTSGSSQRFSMSATLGATDATNGLELQVVFQCGAAGNGTWYYQAGSWQLEQGGIATVPEQRPYGLELTMCQRYFAKVDNSVAYCANVTSGSGYYAAYVLPVPMRRVPDVTGTSMNGYGFPNAVGSLTVGSSNQLIQETRTASATITGGIFGSALVANAEL